MRIWYCTKLFGVYHTWAYVRHMTANNDASLNRLFLFAELVAHDLVDGKNVWTEIMNAHCLLFLPEHIIIVSQGPGSAKSVISIKMQILLFHSTSRYNLMRLTHLTFGFAMPLIIFSGRILWKYSNTWLQINV